MFVAAVRVSFVKPALTFISVLNIGNMCLTITFHEREDVKLISDRICWFLYMGYFFKTKNRTPKKPLKKNG